MLKILSAQAEGEHLAGHNFTLAMLASQTDFLLEKCKTESSTIMQILWPRYKARLHGSVQVVEPPSTFSMLTRLSTIVKHGKLAAEMAEDVFRACGWVRHHLMYHRCRITSCWWHGALTANL